MLKRDSITIRDVAKRAGVHVSTVSRALNPGTRQLISDEVATRIEEAARDLGYSRNALASGLRTKRSALIGVAIPDITNPVFPPILRGIEDTLGAAGYTPIIANTDNDPERQRLVVSRMRGRHVDGFILASVARENDPAVTECLANDLPVVLINRAVDDAAVPSVVTDDARGIRLAVEHLAGLGHRRIAHVAGPQSLSTGFVRYRAFRESIQALGLPAGPDHLAVAIAARFNEAEGMRACEDLLVSARGSELPFTAIVAANDLLALGCYDAFARHGICCPRDVSLTGFNDMPFVDKMNPPLTTVRIPHYEMGVQAAQLLLRQIEKPGSARMSITLAPELVIRGSTAKPPSAAGVG